MILADATKLGRRGPTLLARMADVDSLVTEAAAPPEQLERLADRGVRIDTV